MDLAIKLLGCFFVFLRAGPSQRFDSREDDSPGRLICCSKTSGGRCYEQGIKTLSKRYLALPMYQACGKSYQHHALPSWRRLRLLLLKNSLPKSQRRRVCIDETRLLLTRSSTAVGIHTYAPTSQQHMANISLLQISHRRIKLLRKAARARDNFETSLGVIFGKLSYLFGLSQMHTERKRSCSLSPCCDRQTGRYRYNFRLRAGRLLLPKVARWRCCSQAGNVRTTQIRRPSSEAHQAALLPLSAQECRLGRIPFLL